MSTAMKAWPMRRVGLKVLDLETCLDYYTRLGLSLVRDERKEGMMGMGVGSRELLSLRVLAQGRPRPPHTAGLYHFALLLPDETELGSFLRHCLEQHIPLGGASDHKVSQALYLSDPEGNGIEVYADRPREGWHWEGGSVEMTIEPLDSERLLRLAKPFDGFSPGTLLGHMHLNVGDLDHSAAFYFQLGLELTADMQGQARFLSWESYHHHLGINLWAGRSVHPVEPDVSGIEFFEVQHTGLLAGTLRDPDGIAVVVAGEERSADRERDEHESGT